MKIMCMGDSITFGYGLKDLSQRWSDLLATRTGYTMVNFGINGDTTSGMLVRCHMQVFPQKPDVMLLLGGTNDICRTYDYHQAFANIVSMIQHAKALGIPVIVGIPLPFVPEQFGKHEWCFDRNNEHVTEQCERLAQVLRAYCTAREVPYVDYRSAFLNEDGAVRAELFSDALHPNAAGHQVMADVLFEKLQQLYGRNEKLV